MHVIANYQVPYIMMHMQGIPQNMQKNPVYDDLVKDLLFFFSKKIEEARALNINDLIIDPGFGFGKTIAHNYELLKKLTHFNILELPLLIGLSRKSMIYKLLDTTPNNALNGTTALHSIALYKGVKILRVHDVKEAVESIKLITQLN